MGILSAISDKVIDITLTLIVAVAVHVPLLMGGLLALPHLPGPDSAFVQKPAPLVEVQQPKPIPPFPTPDDKDISPSLKEIKIQVTEVFPHGVIATTTDVRDLNLGAPITFPLNSGEAYIVAKALGFPNSSVRSEQPAQQTGTSTAWLIVGEGPTASFCPAPRGSGEHSVAGFYMEMNKMTGETYIQNTCGIRIIDI